MKKSEIVDYIEAQLEFSPNELGLTKYDDIEIRVYRGKPKAKKNICLNVVIAPKGAFNATEKREVTKNDIKKH